MKQVHVVGLGLNHIDLPLSTSQVIKEAEFLVGGERLLDVFKDHPAEKIPIKSPLSGMITRIKKEALSDKQVVVLADGDPGFFGIGKHLIESLGAERVILYPNVTTLQVAAARLKIPWDAIQTVSLHGRDDLWHLLRALVSNDWVAVYTDERFNPARVADELLQRGVDTFTMWVFENLGQEGERIRHFELNEAAKKTFSHLNFILLERHKSPEIPLHLGLEDNLYLRQKGLITKREIRAVGLSVLEIQPNHTVWDLGAGCGSVAIEASVLAHDGIVFAVERNPARVELIRQNIRRTGAYSVEVISGEMPECLERLPEPDRVFIGGGTGKDTRVLEIATRRLRPGGRLALHLVLMGSLGRSKNYLMDLRWPVSMSQIQISRSRSLAGDQRLKALNPVYVLSATKPKKD